MCGFCIFDLHIVRREFGRDCRTPINVQSCFDCIWHSQYKSRYRELMKVLHVIGLECTNYISSPTNVLQRFMKIFSESCKKSNKCRKSNKKSIAVHLPLTAVL